MHRSDCLLALAVFQRATGEQLWRMLRPHHRHDRITRDTLGELRRRGMVRVESRLASGHQLWVLTARGHAEAKTMLPPHVRMSALRPAPPAGAVRARGAGGFDAHAAAVTSTAAHLIGSGFGTVLSCQTEVAHKLPYGYTQYADLVVRAPDAGVPVLLVEVDRGTEPVDELVAKLRRYREWFELLAPKADAQKAEYAQHGDVHPFRLWSRVYPGTGREGYPPLAFVFAGTTPAQRTSRIQRLKEGAWPYCAGRYYTRAGDDEITAVNYHQAVPVVVTELEQLDAHGAGAAVWKRLGRSGWQTLTDALDNPNGDRLYEAERAEVHRRAQEHAAAAREARRPVCTRCGARFTDARWEQVEAAPRGSRKNELCGPCLEAKRIRDDGKDRMREHDAELATAVQARLAALPDPARRWLR
ncbi:replication-relaxation family protein [Streptodolium elevatio]|uniref:Replication-relaxation family protein n=1 Tax=Streptodolium elevatio TaxID=3157996 RepID=A0ABV3DSH6_9ACTN